MCACECCTEVQEAEDAANMFYYFHRYSTARNNIIYKRRYMASKVLYSLSPHVAAGRWAGFVGYSSDATPSTSFRLQGLISTVDAIKQLSMTFMSVRSMLQSNERSKGEITVAETMIKIIDHLVVKNNNLALSALVANILYYLARRFNCWNILWTKGCARSCI